jgi:hypothetical protein
MRLYVLVEGDTEREFVERLLGPHLQQRGVWVYTSVVETSRDRFGVKRRGGGRWKHWLGDLRRLIAEQTGPDTRFTTMFDLYGLPDDFPDLALHATDKDTQRRADNLSVSMARAVDDFRFIPYLQRHEFEALVLASIDGLSKLLDETDQLAGVEALRALLKNTSPEDINDGKSTAPSKRLQSHIRGYRKTLHGPLSVEDVGLKAIRSKCPRFNAWVGALEALGTISARD